MPAASRLAPSLQKEGWCSGWGTSFRVHRLSCKPLLCCCPLSHPSKPPQWEFGTSMLCREVQRFPASVEEKYIGDTSYYGDGDLCQQR